MCIICCENRKHIKVAIFTRVSFASLDFQNYMVNFFNLLNMCLMNIVLIIDQETINRSLNLVQMCIVELTLYNTFINFHTTFKGFINGEEVAVHSN